MTRRPPPFNWRDGLTAIKEIIALALLWLFLWSAVVIVGGWLDVLVPLPYEPNAGALTP